MSSFVYDVFRMARMPNGDCTLSASENPELPVDHYDVVVWEVGDDGARLQDDPVYEFEGLAAGDVPVVEQILKENLRAEYGETV